MNTGRPKIKVPLEGIDIIIDILSVTILIFMIVYTIITYSELPETIPSHFNAKGEPDGYSDKTTLWFLPILSVGLFLGLFILNKYPHMHNYMVNITEDNALKNYRFSTRIVRFTNLFMTITFALITYSMINSAKNNNSDIGNWILPFIVGTSILLPIVILIYYRKINK